MVEVSYEVISRLLGPCNIPQVQNLWEPKGGDIFCDHERNFYTVRASNIINDIDYLIYHDFIADEQIEVEFYLNLPFAEQNFIWLPLLGQFKQKTLVQEYLDHKSRIKQQKSQLINKTITRNKRVCKRTL